MREKISKEEQEEINHIAWGREVKLPEKKEKKKVDWDKLKKGADKLGKSLFDEESSKKLMGNDTGLNFDLGLNDIDIGL